MPGVTSFVCLIDPEGKQDQDAEVGDFSAARMKRADSLMPDKRASNDRTYRLAMQIMTSPAYQGWLPREYASQIVCFLA